MCCGLFRTRAQKTMVEEWGSEAKKSTDNKGYVIKLVTTLDNWILILVGNSGNHWRINAIEWTHQIGQRSLDIYKWCPFSYWFKGALLDLGCELMPHSQEKQILLLDQEFSKKITGAGSCKSAEFFGAKLYISSVSLNGIIKKNLKKKIHFKRK